MAEKSRRKLVIDCDAGVDDVEAILIALASDDVDIVAITTVSGNCSAENATRNVLRTLKLCGRLDIPVYRGCSTSLLLDQYGSKNFMGNDGLGDVTIVDVDQGDGKLVQSEQASIALCRIVSENPGEITLVALGPLTNIALCQIMDSEFSSKWKDCVIMGGNYQGMGNTISAAEYNWYTDPEAAHNVLTAFPTVTVVPFETCMEYGYTWEFYETYTNLSTKLSRFVRDIGVVMMKNIRQEAQVVPARYGAWDQMAMSVFVDPGSSIAEVKDVYATVELHGAATRGQMVIDWNRRKGKQSNVRLVTKLDTDACQKIMRKAVERM